MIMQSTFRTGAAVVHRLTFGVLMGIGLVAAACGTTEAPGPLQPSGLTGRVRLVNVITDVTRGRVNASIGGVPFGVDLVYSVSAPASLPAPSNAFYAAVVAGDRSLVLKRTADTSVTVATLNFTIAAGQDRTVYAIGGVGNSAVTGFVTTDENPLAAATQTRVRIVNLSPTAGSVDIFVTAPGADLALATPTLAAFAYQGVSAYLVVPAGTYQVRVVPAGTPPANRASSVTINVVSLVLAGGTGRTIVAADNNVGGAPLRAFVLSDR